MRGRAERVRSALARAVGSVRLRITIAAAVVFAVAFGVAAVVLVDSVRSSLEDDVKHDGAVAVARVTRQLQAGEKPEQLSVVGQAGVFVEVRDGAGHVLYATSGPAASPPALGDPPATSVNGAGDPPPGGAASGSTNTPGGNVGGGDGTGVVTAGRVGSDTFVTTQQIATPKGKLTVVASSPLDGVRRSVDTLVSVLLWGTPFLVLAVGLLVWFLVGRALRPVDSIRSEVEVISHGTLHRRVPVPRARDEIARLAATMNEMLDRLDRSARRQREFVSDASHELRSPVASIRAAVEVALHHPELADWPAVVADVHTDNLRMQHVVDELLDLARIDEDGPVGPAPDAEPVEVGDVVAAEVDAIDAPIAVTLAAEPATVVARRSELALVVRNLLNNACRHARHAVRVSVDGVPGDATRLVVDDDGPGIPPAERTRVFERFARLDEARTRDDGGVGLGLAIVRALADRRGWTVAVGDAPGGGARVTVTLPA
ncbi:MAG TPA: HAMP domain-containing sensor histidine kinase [Acidimicrobiia bacterium]|nr:HAMP domain-containing sensor histidine kinase [Acidimicrobiia bacterium]